MELNESPAFLLMDPTIVHTRRDLPIRMYETGGRQDSRRTDKTGLLSFLVQRTGSAQGLHTAVATRLAVR
jgi:hypothetical protein